MDEATRRKFTGCLGRLGSDHDGERAAAALLATRLLRTHGLTWADVVLPGEDPEPKPPAWRDNLDFCRRHASSLTPWERDFVNQMARRRSASPKQQGILETMAAELRAAGCT